MMRALGRKRQTLDRRFLFTAADRAQEPGEKNPNAVADERNDGQQNKENYEGREIFHASQVVKETSCSDDAESRELYSRFVSPTYKIDELRSSSLKLHVL